MALGTVAYPEMRQGRVALSFATLLARSTGQPVPHVDFANPAQSYGIARGQLHYYDALERQGEIRIVRDLDSLKQLWGQWAAWETAGAEGATPPLGFVISMEGADPIQQPEQLEEWYGLGLRLLGITHYGQGRYAGGTATETGLTALGVPLLKEMERLEDSARPDALLRPGVLGGAGTLPWCGAGEPQQRTGTRAEPAPVQR